MSYLPKKNCVTRSSNAGDESPGNSRNDVSGIRSLDETLEMSVVLRVR